MPKSNLLPKPLVINGPSDGAEAIVGVMDCFFGLAVAMANAGYITREEVAEAMECITEQHQGRPDCQSAARQYPAKAMAQLFRTPVSKTFS